MSTEAALLRTIRDMPDEDTPRLVYADYLEEEGFAARAEFIRVQCELARLPDSDPQRNPLEDREHELLAEHECEWLGVSPDDMDGLTEWTFERGFVNEVAASPIFMRGPGNDLCAAHSVRRWRVQSLRDEQREDLRDAGQRGWVSRLEAVDLSGWYLGLGEIAGFLINSNFSRLRELDLAGRGPLEPLPEILEFASFRRTLKVLRCGGEMYGEGGRLDADALCRVLKDECRLEELGVAGSLLTADDLRDLLTSDACSQLTSLDLRSNEIAPDGWQAFSAARCRLNELDISHTPLGAISLDRLLGCGALAGLKRLHMNGCGSAMANIQALAASRYWAGAEELRMQQGSIPETSLDPLFGSSGPTTLRTLDVGQNWVRDGGVRALCDAPWASSLTYLDLSQNYLTDDALRTIAKSGRFKNLRTLHLNYNSVYHQDGAAPGESLTDEGLRALAECPDLANLRVLSLSGLRVTAAGVDAVLNSPHWRLSGLRLSYCQLRPDVINVLASSVRLSRLEVLDLRSSELDDDHFAPLTETEYLSPLTELDIGGAYGGNRAVREALRARLGRRLSE